MSQEFVKRSKLHPSLLLGVKIATLLGVAVVGLGIVYSFSNSSKTPQSTVNETANSSNSHPANLTASSTLAGKYAFQVGTPGPGQAAPPMLLPAIDGSQFNLAAYEGKTVLLFFQEGIMCPACFDQIRDIEQNFSQFKALGIDQMVSISTDSIEMLKQKNATNHYATPLLSDPDLTVSKTYSANLYGMMGHGMNGHSFVLVGPDGIIRWRADYGGAPNYTMFIPVPNLLADIQQGLQRGGVQK